MRRETAFIFCSDARITLVCGMTYDLMLLAGLFVVMAGAAGGAALLTLGVLRWRARHGNAPIDDQIAALARMQAEAGSRMDAMRDLLVNRQAELQSALNERLDS